MFNQFLVSCVLVILSPMALSGIKYIGELDAVNEINADYLESLNGYYVPGLVGGSHDFRVLFELSNHLIQHCGLIFKPKDLIKTKEFMRLKIFLLPREEKLTFRELENIKYFCRYFDKTSGANKPIGAFHRWISDYAEQVKEYKKERVDIYIKSN